MMFGNTMDFWGGLHLKVSQRHFNWAGSYQRKPEESRSVTKTSLLDSAQPADALRVIAF